MSQTEQILSRISVEQGWDSPTMLDLALRYIETQDSPAAWEDFLLDVQAVDNDQVRSVGSPTDYPQAHPANGSTHDLPAPVRDDQSGFDDDWYEGVCRHCRRIIRMREGYRWYHADTEQTACRD